MSNLIAANAPVAVQASKRVALGIRDGRRPDDDGWALTAAELETVLASADAREGPRAFAERRAPVWEGR